MGISSDIIRGYNDLIILFLLIRQPSYGYEISKNIREISREKYVIKETTLYSAFTRMEKNGYIESYSSQEGTGKRRTYYRVTPAGLTYYQEKCDEWILTKEVIEKFVGGLDPAGQGADEAQEKPEANEPRAGAAPAEGLAVE